MPESRLQRTRATLPEGYQFGDAEYGVLGNYECCQRLVSPHPHRAIELVGPWVDDFEWPSLDKALMEARARV